MDSERWHKIESLLQETLERPPAGRDEFLRHACAGDEALEREVQSLLASQLEAEHFLERPAIEVAALAIALKDPNAGLPQTTTQAVSSRFGPYRLEGPLGAGGMGEVFRAIDSRLGRAVAIKTCHAEFTERFQREARAISSLNHPHICTLYDVGPDYLVMELIEGETLAARLKRGKLSVEHSIQYGAQIAEALAAAHAKGIVHRDLKPGNVMIAKTGVKVVDFGLARAPGDGAITAAHGVVGTPAYMAPEQLDGKECGTAADIYALGLVLREMLTGNRLGSVKDHRRSLAHVIERCLESDPDDRWRAASDVAKELKWAGDLPRDSPVSLKTGLSLRTKIVVPLGVIALAGSLWFGIDKLRPMRARPLQPVRISVGLTRAGVAGGTFRLDDDIVLHREQPGTFMAISPDGARLAVQVIEAEGGIKLNSMQAGNVRLATRRLDEARFKPIPGTENSTGPFFSPDGQWLAFFGSGKLRKIPVQGGAPVVLCNSENFPSGSWGDDDSIVAALHFQGGLSRISSSGGAPSPVTELKPGEIRHRWPQVLPGSREILFTSYTGGGLEDSSIEIVSLRTHKRRTLVRGGAMGQYVTAPGSAGSGGGYLIYLRQQTMLAVPFDIGTLTVKGLPQPILDDVGSITPSTPGDFAVSGNGTLVYLSGSGEVKRSIFWLDSTGQRQPLHPAPGFYHGLRFSPDGRRLAFADREALKQQNLWVQDIETNTLVRVTSLPGASVSPVWLPDGKQIIFGVWSQANAGLYTTRADGIGDARRLLKGEELAPYSISPDGKGLAFQSGNPFTGSELLIAPLEETVEGLRLGKQELFSRAPSFPMPAFSPDGKWIAYGSAEIGTDEIYVQPFPGPGAKVPISAGGGEMPIWSRNASELFFISGNHIMVVDYSTSGGSFKATKPRAWSQQAILDAGGPFQPYALAPDGKRFAVLLYPDGTADPRNSLHLTFVLNFIDDLRKRFSPE